MTKAKKLWLSQAEAQRSARGGLSEYGMDRDSDIAPIVKVGHIGEPILVERLDKSGSAYYLVPWMINRKVALVVEIDASNGELSGVSQLPDPTAQFVLSTRVAFDKASSAHPNHEFGQPRLVWRPCRESTSPLRPFFQIHYEEGEVYVDMDGRVYEKLTDLGLGG